MEKENKRELFIWKSDHDRIFLRELLVEQPHQFVYGSKERGNVWQKIAENLLKIEGMSGVTKRAVRKRFDKLYEEFKKRENKEKRDSGVEVEYDEKYQALTEYHELMMEWENGREQKKEQDNEKMVAEDMRKKATERLSATKKRKGDDAQDDSDKPGPSRRKVPKSLVEIMEQSISTRREERMREAEMRAKELKQQETFHSLLLQQQQQFQQQQVQLQQQQQAMNMAMVNTMAELVKSLKH